MPIPIFLAVSPVNWASIPRAGDIQDAFVAYLGAHGRGYLCGYFETPFTIWLDRNEVWCVRARLTKKIVSPAVLTHMTTRGYSPAKIQEVRDYLANGGDLVIIAEIGTVESGCCPEMESIA